MFALYPRCLVHMHSCVLIITTTGSGDYSRVSKNVYASNTTRIGSDRKQTCSKCPSPMLSNSSCAAQLSANWIHPWDEPFYTWFNLHPNSSVSRTWNMFLSSFPSLFVVQEIEYGASHNLGSDSIYSDSTSSPMWFIINWQSYIEICERIHSEWCSWTLGLGQAAVYFN